MGGPLPDTRYVIEVTTRERDGDAEQSVKRVARMLRQNLPEASVTARVVEVRDLEVPPGPGPFDGLARRRVSVSANGRQWITDSLRNGFSPCCDAGLVDWEDSRVRCRDCGSYWVRQSSAEVEKSGSGVWRVGETLGDAAHRAAPMPTTDDLRSTCCNAPLVNANGAVRCAHCRHSTTKAHRA